jgi:pSer/pThr/pTyr-binding forkhead associated (FHA) protein
MSSKAEATQPTGLRVTIYNEVDGTTADLLFQQPPVRIGRNSLNDLVLNHPYVSQWHAVVGLVGEKMSLTQVGSSNSVQIGEYRLRPNEEVLFAVGSPVRIVPFVLYIQPINLPRQTAPTGEQAALVAPDAGGGTAALERTALRVVDRLARRFLGRELQSPEEMVLFADRIERALGVFLRYFVALQKGQKQFREALEIKALRRSEVDEVEEAGELAALLLRRPDGVKGLEQAFKNVMLHQVALLNGLMAGVRSLLGRLSPRAVAKEAGGKHPSVKLLWETYERIHQDLAEEDNETFETIFGPQFGRAYSSLVGQKAKSKDKARSQREADR